MSTRLSLKSVSRRFSAPGGSITVLSDITLEISRGEFVAVEGQSGSGKSTLLSLMAGLDRPSSGEIFYDDKKIDNLPETDLAAIRRDKVGFVFQAFHLVPSLTVLENVLLPGAFRGGSFDEELGLAALDAIGLADRGRFFPAQISGGEKQRVAIARALINEPSLVFADEPTGNLDSENGQKIMDLLETKTVDEGRSLILVTHDASLANRAQRRVHIKDGEIQTG